MKYIFLFSSCLINTFACEPKQKYQDLLNHFANSRNYREIIRHFNCFVEDSNVDKVHEIIKCLEWESYKSQDIYTQIKSDWNNNGTKDHLLKKADEIHEQKLLEHQHVSAANSSVRHDSYIPVDRALQVQSKLKEFDKFLNPEVKS